MKSNARVKRLFERLVQAGTDGLRRKGAIAVGPQDVEEIVLRSAGYVQRGLGASTVAVNGSQALMAVLRDKRVGLKDEKSITAFFSAHRDMIDTARRALSEIYEAFGDQVRVTGDLRDSEHFEFCIHTAPDPGETERTMRRISRSLRAINARCFGRITVTIGHSASA